MRELLKRPSVRFLLVLLVALLALLASCIAVNSSKSKSKDFSIRADDKSVSVTVGGQIVDSLTLASKHGFTGKVSFTFSGLPAGVTVSGQPNPATSPATVVITIAPGLNSPTGTYTLLIKATSGKLHHNVQITVDITGQGGPSTGPTGSSSAPPSATPTQPTGPSSTPTQPGNSGNPGNPGGSSSSGGGGSGVGGVATSFTLTLSPSVQTVFDGQSTAYALALQRGLQTGAINFAISGLPSGASASIVPSLHFSGTSAQFKISTTTNVVPGKYLITVKGTSSFGSVSASVFLIVKALVFPNFPISGNVPDPLAPGITKPINLSLTNPLSRTMTVTNLGVVISHTSSAACATSNFLATQYTGPASLVIPANSTKTLSQLGVPSSAWPTIGMKNLPTNQDSCKNITITLGYSGKGHGN